MIQLQVFNDLSSDFEQTVTLDSYAVTLRIMWNVRSQFWEMRVTNANEDMVSGIKMVPNWPLLNQHKALMPIPGDFLLIREDPYAGEFPTFDNLGSLFNLYYLDADEVATWKALNGVG